MKFSGFIKMVACAMLFAFGIVMMYHGFNTAPTVDQAVAKSVDIVAPKTQKPTGKTSLTLPSAVSAVPGPSSSSSNPTGTVTVNGKNITPNRLFIPALGIYAPINTTGNNGRVTNGYLNLPGPNAVTRFTGGANVTDASGTILIAGHVVFNGVPGQLHNLNQVRAGYVAWVSDASGNAREFQLQSAVTPLKNDLPQSVFDKNGSKKLVVVTCGGVMRETSPGEWHYDRNVVATFIPVK